MFAGRLFLDNFCTAPLETGINTVLERFQSRQCKAVPTIHASESGACVMCLTFYCLPHTDRRLSIPQRLFL